MKLKEKLKTLLNWNSFLLLIIFLLMIAGFVLIVISGETSNNIALGCGSGLISSGIVSSIIEITHIISIYTQNKKLKDDFYYKVKNFISVFLYYASFCLEKEQHSPIEMLEYQSKHYKDTSSSFNKLPLSQQTLLFNEIRFKTESRRIFKLYLSQINNYLYESVIHGIITPENKDLLEYIIHDYNNIIEDFNENASYSEIADSYVYLLNSVALLIEKDENLKMFKLISFHKKNSSTLIYGRIKKEDYKYLSKQDMTILHNYIEK